MSTNLTLEEFMKFSKELSKEQAIEQAKVRAKERADDLVIIKGVIESSVKTEIDVALNPVIERQNIYEAKTDKAISDMSTELATNRALVTLPQAGAHPQPHGPAGPAV